MRYGLDVADVAFSRFQVEGPHQGMFVFRDVHVTHLKPQENEQSATPHSMHKSTFFCIQHQQDQVHGDLVAIV
jgi:hypothetical protein